MTLLISLINNSEIKGAMPTPSSLQEEKIKLAKAIAKAIRKDEKIDLVDQNYNNFNALLMAQRTLESKKALLKSFYETTLKEIYNLKDTQLNLSQTLQANGLRIGMRRAYNNSTRKLKL